jgi:peroxiredoxin
MERDMSLQDQLSGFRASWEERVGDDIASTVAAHNDALRRSGIAARALGPGARFPDLALADARGGRTRIYDKLARGPLVVTFYRGGWCPYCSLELRAYQAALGEIRALGADLVAVSPEMPDAQKNALEFDVLSDTNGALADALGIRFELAPPIVELYRRAGNDLAARNGDGRWSLPMPATYVLRSDGTIALAFVDPEYRRRLEPAAALGTLRDIEEQI